MNARLNGMRTILAAALCALAAQAEPVRVIVDTDMITDFDDVGALACVMGNF